MNIAIIGAGNVGKALTGSALKAGHSVTVSSAERRLGRGAGRGDRRPGGRVQPGSRRGRRPRRPRRAVHGRGRRARARSARRSTARSSSTRPTRSRPTTRGWPPTARPGAEEIQAKAPGARVVKAFNTAFAARQADPKVAGGLRVDGYVAADDEDAKATVLGLAEAIGFNPVDAGGLAMARQLEALAWLNISLQMQTRLELAGRLEARRARTATHPDAGAAARADADAEATSGRGGRGGHRPPRPPFRRSVEPPASACRRADASAAALARAEHLVARRLAVSCRPSSAASARRPRRDDGDEEAARARRCRRS